MSKKVRIPWWKVPKKILMDVVESTGQDPTKMTWHVDVENWKIEAKFVRR